MEISFQNKTLTIKAININGLKAVELSSNDLLIEESITGVELLVDLYYQNFDIIVIHKKNITSTFFDLSSGMAGNIFQKATNFRMRIAIIGDFLEYRGKSFGDFITESNTIGKIIFAGSVQEAKERYEMSKF